MAGHLISADLVPIGASYLVVMGALGTGLWLRRRDSRPAAAAGGPVSAGPVSAGDPVSVGPASASTVAGDRQAPAGRTRPFPSGWPALAAQVMATVLGGYLLLMVVLTGYYFGVSRVGDDFLGSAWSGCAMLAGLALPVFAAASWLASRRAVDPARPPAAPPSGGPSGPSAGPEPVPG